MGIRRASIGVFVALFSLACVRSPGGIAPSNIPLAPDGYVPLGPVTASDCKVNLLGSLPISGSNRIADAERKALGKIDGAQALVDVSIDRSIKFFILWSQVCTEVHATAVALR